MRSILLALCLTLGGLALGGCLSRTVAEPIRYFHPELPHEAAAAPARPARPEPDQKPDPVTLRLRRVGAAAYLKDRLARRTSDVEVTFADLVRWTEPPVAYLEHALTRELFEARGLARTESTGGLRLDVELRAFDETLESPRSATVAIWASLVEGDAPRFERTFEAKSVLATDDPAALARGMGIALDDAVRQLGQAVDETIRRSRK